MEPTELNLESVSSHQDAQVATPARRVRRRWVLPLMLFLLTCWTTSFLGGTTYAACILLILLCHEFGHYLMARYRAVDASLPYFIPMPIGPFGTMGAVIGMPPRQGNRRDIFDIGIAGPLAGLVPTLICLWIGIQHSRPVPMDHPAIQLAEPLLMQWMVAFLRPEALGPQQTLLLHPVAFAGWAGLFVTTLNLLPVGQLDGGHILYGMFRKKSYPLANAVLMVALVAIILNSWWQWTLMLALLVMVGPEHPPTADDTVPLGAGRYWLGGLTLLMVPLGFVPNPFP